MSMDVSLKQRLIGAVVLIALAVIFLPLLVKGPAPDSGVSGVSLRMPAEPARSGDTITEELPLDAPGPTPANGATGMPAPVQGQPAAAAPDAAPEPDTQTPLAAVAAGDFAVNFGNYKDAADADKVIAALRAVGLPGYREKTQVGGREVQRVRVGPFADQATAESARIRAGRVSTTVEAKVVALDATPEAASAATPATPAQATPPKPAVEMPKPTAPAVAAAKPATAAPKPAVPVAKPEASTSTAAAAPKPAAAEPPPAPPANPSGTGFVVQVGAFADAATATALRDKLRGAGFNAFTDTVPISTGRLTRVRVGPVMNRAEADALKARVKSVAHLEGNVLPHP